MKELNSMKNSLLVFITVFIVNLAVVPVSSAADNQAVIDLKKAEQLVASADLKKVNVFLQKNVLEELNDLGKLVCLSFPNI